MASRRQRLALLTVTGLAFAVRVLALDGQSLWRDEIDAIRFASGPLAELLGMFSQPGQNGPLYYLLLRPWLGVAGESAFAVRFFSLSFGLLTVPLLYQLGRRLFPRWPQVALLVALLATLSPYLVWYSQEGKMYSLVVCLIVLSMERYLAALERGGWGRWLAYVAFTSAAFYVHLLAALIVPVQMVVFVLVGRRDGYRRWKPWLFSLAALTLPYLPLLAWQMPLLFQKAVTGYRFVPLDDMLISLLTSYSLGVLERPSPWLLVPFVGLLLAGGALVRRREWRLSVGVLLTWLLLPLAALFLITLLRPMYTARYLIFVLPAYLLLLALALVAVGQRSRLAGGALLVSLLVVNGWGLWVQARTPIKADFRSATAYVAQRLEGGDLLIFQIPHGRHSFDYYFRRQEWPKEGVLQSPLSDDAYRLFLPFLARGQGAAYRWADGLYTNAGLTAGEVDRRMRELTAGSRVVWLIATEVPMWDADNLVQGWLEEHGRLREEAHFVRVDVYRYELGGP